MHDCAPGVDLNRVKLGGFNLAEVRLRDASLILADPRGANLSGAQLLRADLRGADLGGADLSYADLNGETANRFTHG
jgi:uncharacterized protein YjbI with pentapeptide repeats